MLAAGICGANCSFNDFGDVMVTYEVIVVSFIDFSAVDKSKFTQQRKFVCILFDAKPSTNRNF